MNARFLVAGLLVFAACGKTSEKPAAETKVASRIEAAKTMALAPVNGTSPIDKTIVGLQNVARQNATKADNWIMLGRAWVQKARQSADPGFYLHADACAELALDVKPNYPLALDLRAIVMMNDHRFNDARELAKSILAQDSDDLIALGALSDAELELGNYDAAIDAAQKMMDLKPNLPSYSRAGHLRWLRGDIAESKRIMKAAMDAGLDQRDPEPGAWVICEAAKIFFHEGDYEGAEAGFDRALARFVDYPPALLGKARVALALGKPERAAELAKKSFEGSPLAETAWVWGDAERAAGREEASRQAYEQVLKLGRQGDKRTLAYFFATENRDLDEAMKAIAGELEHRGDIYTHDAHAWVLYRAGRFDEAKKASDRAMRLGTKDATLMYHAGAVAIAGGNIEAGVKLVKDALAINPQFQVAGVREAKALLEKHSK